MYMHLTPHRTAFRYMTKFHRILLLASEIVNREKPLQQNGSLPPDDVPRDTLKHTFEPLMVKATRFLGSPLY